MGVRPHIRRHGFLVLVEMTVVTGPGVSPAAQILLAVPVSLLLTVLLTAPVFLSALAILNVRMRVCRKRTRLTRGVPTDVN